MNLSKLDLRDRKRAGEKLAMLTAYDYPVARMLDENGIDLILVGDSLGMVVLGYPDTVSVTLDDMLHHTRAVARGVKRATVIADLPYATYETPDQGAENAQRLIEAGAHAVKLEGGVSKRAHIEKIRNYGIPVVGHIGMLPQRVREEGGYRIKGRSPEESASLLADAKAVEEAGASAVVLELVLKELTAEITAALRIPTIGIGSGPDCDGQVLVVHDLIGMFPWFRPKFAKPEADVGPAIAEAVQRFVARVHEG